VHSDGFACSERKGVVSGTAAELVTHFGGWSAAILLGVGLALPYFLRPTGLSRSLPLPPGSSRPYLERLRPHYLAGLLAIGLSVSHAYASMRTPAVRHPSAAGLWLATGALGLLLMQAAIGQTLRRPELVGRRSLRVSHYWMALAVVSLLIAHISLNG
jgi:hypothetical protein